MMEKVALRRRILGRLPVLTVVLTFAVIAAACGGGSGNQNGNGRIDKDVQEAYDQFVKTQLPGITVQQVQAAKDEGTVSYYTGFFGDGNINGFKDRFPFIKLEPVTLTAGPLAQRFMSEKQSGVNRVDVYTAPEGGVLPAVDAGYCAKYTPTSDSKFLPADKVPGVAYRWGGGYYGIAFVPQRMKPGDVDALTKWSGLADPRFAGRVTGVSKNPPGSGTAYAWDNLFKILGPQVLEKHATLGQIKNYSGTTEETSALLLGEIDLATMITLSGPAGVYAAGAPIGWVTPEPLIISPWSGCIATKAPHMNAAKLLWEYILSDEGQLSMLPANHSYKQGLDLAKGLPEGLAKQPWYRPPNVKDLAPLTIAQDKQISPQLETFWKRVYLRGS